MTTPIPGRCVQCYWAREWTIAGVLKGATCVNPKHPIGVLSDDHYCASFAPRQPSTPIELQSGDLIHPSQRKFSA